MTPGFATAQGAAVPAFQQRWPWIGADLQTLRDTLRPLRFPPDRGQPERISVSGGELLAKLDLPAQTPRALVIVLHGLGGSCQRTGVRRMALVLQGAGLAVLRLNLRGAGAGRALAPGTYAAACNADLLPVLNRARALAGALTSGGKPVPLLGVGLSLGGTILLNALLEQPSGLDGLACVSSPLDLTACSAQIEAERNRLYQRWLLQRLVQQTLADPWGVTTEERTALLDLGQPQTSEPQTSEREVSERQIKGRSGGIRGFDAAITAPRWCFGSVEDYYRKASPLPRLLQGAPPTPLLVLQALDDPWVPAEGAQALARAQQQELARGLAPIAVVLTARGGHNGFHAAGDPPLSCWSDALVLRWLEARISSPS